MNMKISDGMKKKCNIRFLQCQVNERQRQRKWHDFIRTNSWCFMNVLAEELTLLLKRDYQAMV